MAMFHTEVLDKQIKALPTIATASGSIATFTTDKAENLVECEVQIVAVQSGSGTPSPTNPRAISGYSACNLSHSDADTSNPTVYNIPFGQTIYGGVLNVGSGVLTVTHGYKDLGTLTWNSLSRDRWNSTDIMSVVKTPLSNSRVANILCEIYTAESADTVYLQNVGIAVQTTGDLTLYDTNLVGKTQSEVTTYLTGHKLIYELATPTTIQLDSKTIQTIANSENNIWSDTGDISVQFILSVGSYVNQNV